MSLRLDGGYSSFEEAYPRAPFAPLIHMVVVLAEAISRLRRPREAPLHGDRPVLPGTEGTMPTTG